MSSKPLFVFALAVMLSTAGVAPCPGRSIQGPQIQLVGGDGGFDYVTADADGRNLYVARSGPAGHIGVFNLDTLAQVGDIPGASAHGAAVDTATGHGFATSKPVTMFDSKTFAILKKIDVEGNPDGYLNDAYNHHFYILSHSAPNITVLDDKMAPSWAPSTSWRSRTSGHRRPGQDLRRYRRQIRHCRHRRQHMKMVGKYIFPARVEDAPASLLTPKTTSSSPLAARRTT